MCNNWQQTHKKDTTFGREARAQLPERRERQHDYSNKNLVLQKSALLPPRAVFDQLGGCTHLPKLGTDLVSTLSSLYVNDLSHLSQALLRFSAKVIRQAVNSG